MITCITASTGIGADTARILAARRDAGLFVVSRTADHVETLLVELRGLGAEAYGFSGDLTDPATAPAAISACVHHFGRIDALYNVAGGSGRSQGDGPVHLCSEGGWTAVMAQNLTSMYRMCREAVRVMLAQGPGPFGRRGVILNMSSILAIDPDPGHFETHAYAASKGAIIALSRAMAASYAGSGIRVNAIAPGLTGTPMSARASGNQEIVDFIQRKQPLTGIMAASDVATASAFLLGPESSAITGTTMVIDGGWSLS